MESHVTAHFWRAIIERISTINMPNDLETAAFHAQHYKIIAFVLKLTTIRRPTQDYYKAFN